MSEQDSGNEYAYFCIDQTDFYSKVDTSLIEIKERGQISLNQNAKLYKTLSSNGTAYLAVQPSSWFLFDPKTTLNLPMFP